MAELLDPAIPEATQSYNQTFQLHGPKILGIFVTGNPKSPKEYWVEE